MSIFDKVETHYIVKLDEYGTSIHIIESLKNKFQVQVFMQYNELVISEPHVLSPDAKTVLIDFLNKPSYTYIGTYYDIADIMMFLFNKFQALKKKLEV